MKLVKLLANLGYGSRKEVERLIKGGAVTDDEGTVIGEKNFPAAKRIRFMGEELDPEWPLTLILNKPEGYTCSTDDPGDTIYDLLPERFSRRNPGLNPAGRLDKETRGLLIMTDDGKLLHQIIHPKSNCLKVYHVFLARPLRGDEEAVFGSGEMLLNSENKPLLSAGFEVLGEKEALVTLHEGRYHQVRRMFAAVENHVMDLRRISIGGLKIPNDLAEGEWRRITDGEMDTLFGRE